MAKNLNFLLFFDYLTFINKKPVIAHNFPKNVVRYQK